MRIRRQVVIDVEKVEDACEFCGRPAEFRIVSVETGNNICGICLKCIELLRGISKQGE